MMTKLLKKLKEVNGKVRILPLNGSRTMLVQLDEEKGKLYMVDYLKVPPEELLSPGLDLACQDCLVMDQADLDVLLKDTAEDTATEDTEVAERERLSAIYAFHGACPKANVGKVLTTLNNLGKTPETVIRKVKTFSMDTLQRLNGVATGLVLEELKLELGLYDAPYDKPND